ESFPAIEGEFAVITGHRALVSVLAFAEDGRMLDAAAELEGELTSVDTSVELDPSGEYALVRAAEAGERELTFTTATADLPLTLSVVAPEDIVSLDIDSLFLDDGGTSLSVVGVTADGVRVIGLEPTVTVAGEPLTSTLGDWLFETQDVPET